jgi:hypothetical protein
MGTPLWGSWYCEQESSVGHFMEVKVAAKIKILSLGV